METALHIMGHLKNKHNTQLVFDLTYLDIDKGDFPHYDWTEFYGNAKEPMPADMPMPLGKDVDLQMMVDSDHSGDKRIRQFWTDFLIFCNMAPYQLGIQEATDH